MNAESLKVSLSPQNCICPNEGYTCEVNLGTEISWMTENTDDLEFSLFDMDDEFQQTNNLQVVFSGVIATDLFDNYTSTLFILTPLIVNGTNITCTGQATIRNTSGIHTETTNVTTRACIIGNIHYYTRQIRIDHNVDHRSCITTY